MRISWHRVLPEAAVIIVSILLALAADASWQAREARSDETRRLVALRQELEDARSGFIGHLSYLNQQDSLAYQLLREVQQYSGDSRRLDSLMFRLGPFVEYSPPLAAYDDATSASGLSVIRSDSVRRTLAEYRRLLADDLAEQRISREQFDREMAPLWETYINTWDHYAVGQRLFAGLLPADLPAVPFASLYREMLQDRRFANQIVARVFGNFRIRSKHREVIGAIDNLLDQLDAYNAPTETLGW